MQQPTMDTEVVGTVRDQLASMDPATALQTIGWLRAEFDHLEHAQVTAMREAGASWTDVGQALGSTRQNAYQRFGTGSARQTP